MIAVDTSAIVAILQKEDGYERFTQCLEEEAIPVMSAAIFVELGAVMKNRGGEKAIEIADRLLEYAGIQIEPLTGKQARLARDAYSRYSALNFGDCFSYALAKEKGIPLLFKGDDFTKTDIESALDCR